MNERKLTKSELAKREDIIMKMKKNKRALTQKYGKDAEAVMYGRATKLAKKQAESMDQDKIKELVKDALQNPKKADLNKDGKLSDYEKKRGAAIEKNLDEMDLNDPVAMRLRADKAKRAANAGDDGNDKFFRKNAVRLRKLKALKDKRAEIMRDMEQEAELEGGPVADRYGDMLNAVDAEIAKEKAMFSLEEEFDLDVKGGTEPDKDSDVAGILGAEDVLGLEEGASTEEKRIAMRAIKSIAKYRGVSNDEARNDLVRAAKEIGDLKEGFYGPGSVESVANALGYSDVYEFFEDNPGVTDAILDWAENVPEFREMLQDADLLQEDLDLGHQDNEPHMLKADLYRIGKYAMELYQMVDRFEEGSEEVDFPHWWQSKVIKAKDMLVSAKHYLDFEIKEPQIDAMVDVAQDVEAIDEAKFTDYSNNELAAYCKNNPEDKAAAAELKKRSQKLKDLSRTDINEGVWSLGTSQEIKDAIHTLETWYESDARQISALFDDKDNSNWFYNVVGDDLFHDYLNRVETAAASDNTDGAHNAIGDAIGRAEELLAFVQKSEGVKEGLPKGYWDKKMDAKDEVSELLDDTPQAVVAKANNKIVNVATMAKSLLDIYDDFKAKEKIDFEANSNFVQALKFLTKAAQPQIDKETKGVDVQTEDYDALVNKIKKQGKSEKAAKAIAGAVASYKAKGGGKGPTAKQKARG